MEILTLLKANIKHKHGAFKSIAALMLIISLCVSVVLSLQDNQFAQYEKAYNSEVNGDLIIFADNTNYSDELINKIESSKLVEKTDTVYALKNDYYKLNKTDDYSPMMLVPYDYTKHGYGLYNESLNGYIENPSAPDKGEVYLPLGMKSHDNCVVGDYIYFKNNGEEQGYKIAGFVEDALLGAYTIGYKHVFMSKEDYDELYAMSADDGTLTKIELINVYKSDSCKLDDVDFKQALNDETGFLTSAFATSSFEEARSYTTMFTSIFGGILYVFIILLFMVVLIIIGHSISTGIEMDYVNLGVLKSQGFTKGKIRAALMLQYLIALVIGSVLGAALAIPAVILFGSIFQPITGILPTAGISVVKVIGVIIAVLILAVLFVTLRTNKIAKISPVRAISGGRESIYFDSRLNMPIAKKGLTFTVALRQFTSNKRQYIGTILIVTILVYFMLSMTILANCMTPTSMSEGFGEIVDDFSILLMDKFGDDDIEEIESAVNEISKIKESAYTKGDYFELNNHQLYGRVMNNPMMFKSVISGRAPLYDNEIVTTEIIKEKYGIKQGDTVTVKFNDKSEEYIVSGIFQSMNDVGNVFGISGAGFARLSDAYYRYGHILLENSEDAEKVVNMLNERFSDRLTAANSDGNDAMLNLIQTSLNICMTIIYVISVVFVMIVVTMVCGKSFLREKSDIGIFKSLGFTTSALRRQFSLRFVIVAIIGSAVGVILSLSLNSLMMGVLLKSMGITRFSAEYNMALMLIPVALICLCFFLFSYIASRKIKTVSVRTLITE